jgi:hypothetical protein
MQAGNPRTQCVAVVIWLRRGPTTSPWTFCGRAADQIAEDDWRQFLLETVAATAHERSTMACR